MRAHDLTAHFTQFKQDNVLDDKMANVFVVHVSRASHPCDFCEKIFVIFGSFQWMGDPNLKILLRAPLARGSPVCKSQG